MKAALEAWTTKLGAGLRRVGGAIRRHPWRAAGALPVAVAVYVAALYPFTPSIGDIRKSKQESPTVVLSADGKELAVFKRANRDWVKLQDISPKVVEALLATEDHRFYDHIGIDFVRTGKAVINTLSGDIEGGSTLTQQLARNLYPEEIGREQTVTRKVKEAITALKIEAIYSKDEILETYLNSVSFLYNAWGIEMAARTYFDKPAKALNELEAATLVGMLKGTSHYNPVLNPERAVERRNTVLAMMVRHDKLSEAEFERLKARPMRLDFERLPEFNGEAPHLAQHLKRWLLDWADRHDYNIYADGLVVRTTIDSRLQAAATEAVRKQGEALQAVADVEWSRSALPSYGTDPAAYAARRSKEAAFDHFWNSKPELVNAFVRESGEFRALRDQGKSAAEALEQLKGDGEFMARLRRQKTTLQAGFLAIDPNLGYVKAWVGSRDYEDDKFDHVNQARRQPGSTFKPFVYGAAFDMGIHPSETLMDAPVAIQIDKNQVWRPGDVGAGPTNQPMTLREALARSKNTITAQLMMRVGPDRVASLARAMGVRESKLSAVPSLALGTSPVTLKEMVTAFGTIANGGSYIEPVLVTAIEDRHGNTIDAFHPSASEPAMSNQAAQTLLDVMRGSIEFGTAVGLKHRFGLNGDFAGKTGTTQDNTDGWFILMHPQLVAGAWMGFNDNRVTMRSEYWGQGSHNALLVVGDFFQRSAKVGLVDAKAAFAAPRMKVQEEQPLMDRMGDWWNNVFNTAPAAPEPAVAAVPEVKLDPPVLEPAPQSIETLPAQPATAWGYPSASPSQAPLVTPQAPVVVSGPERVPAFPRPLDIPPPSEPVASVPGTQVYRLPETPARRSDATATATGTARSGTGAPGTGSSAATASTLPSRPAPAAVPVERRAPEVLAAPAPGSATLGAGSGSGYGSAAGTATASGSATGSGGSAGSVTAMPAAPATATGSAFSSDGAGGSSGGASLE